MGAHELSAMLWHERELLELLVFKLEEEQLLLTAVGQVRGGFNAIRCKSDNLGDTVDLQADRQALNLDHDYPRLSRLKSGG